MNHDLKYVLLPKIEERRRPPKFQPWYRERLKAKYPCRMDTKNWKFVKDGLDDFRDGLPPSHNNIILEPVRGPSPVIMSRSREVKANVSNGRTRLSDYQMYFSRELPNTGRRRQLIDSYISEMIDHPLTIFPHYGQTLPPEVYEKVIRLLERELGDISDEEQQNTSTDDIKENIPTFNEESANRDNTTSTERSSTSHANNDDEPEEVESKRSSTRPGRTTIVYDESGVAWNAEELERKQKNPYRWYIEQQQKQSSQGSNQEDEATSAMETRLRSVSEQFCTWLYDLGGETNLEVDPAVVRNLFSTAYDTKPCLSVPIKLVEMTRIPPELREGAQESMIPEPSQRKTTFPELKLTSSIKKSKSLSVLPNDSIPNPRKYRYGAWYLPKSLWKYSPKVEELKDPKTIAAEREDPARKRDEMMNSRLAPLHGIDAFKEYLVEKNIRRLPKLITDVEQYRRDNPPEAVDPNGAVPSKSVP